LPLYLHLSHAGTVTTAAAAAADEPPVALTSRDEIVPCDCVLVRGKAVVNEASLTGKSVYCVFFPQHCVMARLKMFSVSTLPRCLLRGKRLEYYLLALLMCNRLFISTGESVPQMKEALTYSTANAATAGASDKTATSDSDVNLDNLNGQDSADTDSTAAGGNEKLDMNGLNRVNVLFSGCSFVTVDGLCSDAKNGNTAAAGSGVAGIPSAPDGGALAYVLRTGFGSSQGSLLQMIEFSQQTVAGR
jgi:magnesium-transporting ATPase (P-type)